MPDITQLVAILVSVVTGASIAIVAGCVAHVLATQRWQGELRHGEVTHWQQYADDWFNLALEAAELRSVAIIDATNDVKSQMARDEGHTARFNALWTRMSEGTRRAPEPLTEHVRLFSDRMHRASETQPFDIELGRFAIVHFRAALNDYMRKGRTAALRLIDDENPQEYDRVKGVFRLER